MDEQRRQSCGRATAPIFLARSLFRLSFSLTASTPFPFDPAAGIRAPASKPRAGDAEFRITAPLAAVALETAHPEEFPGLDPAGQLAAFRQRLETTSRLTLDEATATGRYANRLGDAVECTFNGPDRINGTEVDYQAWPSSESPWTAQKTAEGPLEVTDGTTVRTYDFATWTITEKPVKPVTAAP